MSTTISHRVGSDGFALLVRLFAGLKRKGRVIDVIWFQQDLDYARAILALADNTEDDSVRDISARLRKIMGAVLAAPTTQASAEAVVRNSNNAGAVTTAPAALPSDPVAPEDRYIGRLR